MGLNSYTHLIVLLVFSNLHLSNWGQGTLLFSNYVPNYGVDAPIFDAAGNRVEGSNYHAAMYAGPAAGSLTFRAEAPFLLGALSGYFEASVVTARDFLAGIPTSVQIAAWDTSLGTSYEAVKGLGIGGYGESKIFQAVPGNPGGGVPSLPGVFTELQSFSLVPEPEASWILSLGLFLWFSTRRFVKTNRRYF